MKSESKTAAAAPKISSKERRDNILAVKGTPELQEAVKAGKLKKWTAYDMCQDKFPADLQNYIVWRLFSFKPGSVPPKNTLPVFVAPVEEAKTGKKAKKANQAVDQSFKAQIAAAPKDFKGGDAHQFAGEGNLPKDASGKVDMNPAKTVKKVKSKKVINLVPNDIKNPQAA